MSPFDAWRFLSEAQAVMFRRSMALLSAEPHKAGTALLEMAAEKQIAFSQGAAAAGLAMARGESPDAVMEAALKPAQQRVRRNVRRKGLA